MAYSKSSRDTVLSTSSEIKALLKQLHSENSKQDKSWHRKFYRLKFLVYALRHLDSRPSWDLYNDRHCGNQYLSHSKEKCEFMYMLARLNKSRNIIECGTSFGTSTIYFALAVSQNVCNKRQDAYGVLTMEKDAGKMEKAKKNWVTAGSSVEQWIHPRTGDILQILSQDGDLPKVVDLLFLDAWPPVALPALKILLPKMRDGSLVIADKTASGTMLELLEYIHDSTNNFSSTTLPFPDGFEVMVYSPPHSK